MTRRTKMKVTTLSPGKGRRVTKSTQAVSQVPYLPPVQPPVPRQCRPPVPWPAPMNNDSRFAYPNVVVSYRHNCTQTSRAPTRHFYAFCAQAPNAASFFFARPISLVRELHIVLMYLITIAFCAVGSPVVQCTWSLIVIYFVVLYCSTPYIWHVIFSVWSKPLGITIKETNKVNSFKIHILK